MATEEQPMSSVNTSTNNIAAPLPSPLFREVAPMEIPSRSESPSPSVTPSMALDAIPRLDRSVSTPSSSAGSTLSTGSRKSRLSDGGSAVVKRRGYMRPQGTAFADSARNRDSVMSLGSIAHMQYYFARTGLLDGKGAQARGMRKKASTSDLRDKENVEPMRSLSHGAVGREDFVLSSLSLNDGNTSAYAVSEPGLDHSLVESPTELYANPELWMDPGDPIMLPPTVSTYKLKPEYTEPVPDLPVLRRELKEALQDACKVLEESQKDDAHPPTTVTSSPTSSPSHSSSSTNSSPSHHNPELQGFYEVQGLHLLDITTLAIRAAKNYYTAHPDPARLYAIKAEKDIRAELYSCLDILKRMAARNFRGGIRLTELTEIITWIESIDRMLKKEEAAEQAEAAERASWTWRDDAVWTPGTERTRERAFLVSFEDPSLPMLPAWNAPVTKEGEEKTQEAKVAEGEKKDHGQPTPFLEALRDGQRLVNLHNALVARSRRKFGEIKSWHTDVGKPYRMAENLRFWAKAAELRWEVRLEVPALDIVQGEAWLAFDRAVLEWCGRVRRELTEEWDAEAASAERRLRPPPELKVEVSSEAEEELDDKKAGEDAAAEHADTTTTSSPTANGVSASSSAESTVL